MRPEALVFTGSEAHRHCAVGDLLEVVVSQMSEAPDGAKVFVHSFDKNYGGMYVSRSRDGRPSYIRACCTTFKHATKTDEVTVAEHQFRKGDRVVCVKLDTPHPCFKEGDELTITVAYSDSVSVVNDAGEESNGWYSWRFAPSKNARSNDTRLLLCESRK